MKYFYEFTLLTLVIFGSLMVSENVFAQKSSPTPDVTVTTDKSSYIYGDTIIISGTVKTVVQETLTIRVLDPYSNLIEEAQGIVAQDGHYTGSIEITGTMWKAGGVYTVLVQYGSTVQGQTTFSYTATTPPIYDKFQVQIPNNGTFDVPYSIYGGSVSNVVINPTNYSLAVLIQSNNYGSITLSLPRSLIDSKTNGSDVPFTILIDGNEIKAQREQVTSTQRTLTIQFLQGDKEIQIIGTSVGSQNGSMINALGASLTTNQSSELVNMSQPFQAVPEFPKVAMPLLILFIMIIVLARTSGRRYKPSL